MTTNEKIETLTNVLRETIKYLKGTQMSTLDSYDFDQLLEDVDNIVTTPTKEKEVPSEIDEIDSLLDDPAVVVKAADEVMDDLSEQKKEIEEKEKAITAVKANVIANTVNVEYEYADEAKAFLREYEQIEREKKELKEREKNLKNEYKESGVDVKAVLKARAEIIKELKESETEAKIVEDVKQIIKADDGLFGNLNEIAKQSNKDK